MEYSVNYNVFLETFYNYWYEIPETWQNRMECKWNWLWYVGNGRMDSSNDDESMLSLQLSVDLGCNFFDTAWGYGKGKSEALLENL